MIHPPERFQGARCKSWGYLRVGFAFGKFREPWKTVQCVGMNMLGHVQQTNRLFSFRTILCVWVGGHDILAFMQPCVFRGVYPKKKQWFGSGSTA